MINMTNTIYKLDILYSVLHVQAFYQIMVLMQYDLIGNCNLKINQLGMGLLISAHRLLVMYPNYSYHSLGCIWESFPIVINMTNTIHKLDILCSVLHVQAFYQIVPLMQYDLIGNCNLKMNQQGMGLLISAHRLLVMYRKFSYHRCTWEHPSR